MLPIWITVSVSLIFGLGMIILIIARLRKYTHNWIIRNVFSWLYLLKLSFFPVATKTISVFNCKRDPGTDIWYFQLAPNVRCDDIPMGLKILAQFSYIIPFFIFVIVVIMFRKKRDEKNVQRAIGFLYICFKSKYYYMTVVLMGRQFILALFIAMINDSSFLTWIICLILIATEIFMAFVKPYSKSIENLFEVSLAGAVLIVYCTSSVIQLSGDHTEVSLSLKMKKDK